jgi:hypothetical protein
MPLKESHPLANPTRGSFTCQLYFPMLGRSFMSHRFQAAAAASKGPDISSLMRCSPYTAFTSDFENALAGP